MELDDPRRLDGVEAAAEHHSRRQQGGHGDVGDDPGDVEKRRDAEDHVVGGKLEPLAVALGAEDHVPVGVHSALRRAGRARRVSEERDVVGPKDDGLWACTAAGADELEEVFRLTRPTAIDATQDARRLTPDEVELGRRDDGSHIRGREHERRHLGIQRLECDEHPCARVLELLAQLLLLEHRVARHDDAADLPRRQHGEEELRLVLKVDRDAIPAAESEIIKGRGERIGHLVDLAERQRRAEVVDQRLIGGP